MIDPHQSRGISREGTSAPVGRLFGADPCTLFSSAVLFTPPPTLLGAIRPGAPRAESWPLVLSRHAAVPRGGPLFGTLAAFGGGPLGGGGGSSGGGGGGGCSASGGGVGV